MSRSGLSTSRRQFLRAGAAASAAVPLASTLAADLTQPGEVRRYATLGRTGLKISDVSFGSASLRPGQEKPGPFRARAGHQLFRYRRELLRRQLRNRARQGAQGQARPSGDHVEGGGPTGQQRRMAHGCPGRVAEASADGLCGHIHEPRRQRRCRDAESGVARVHRPRQAAGQDPLRGHVGTCRPPHRLSGVCVRRRHRGCRAGRAQLRSGSEILRTGDAVHGLGRHPAGFAPLTRQGQGQGRRRHRDENAPRCAPERHAPVREGRRDIRPGGAALGALQPACRCRGHHHEQRRQGERVPGCLGLAQTRLPRHAVA